MAGEQVVERATVSNLVAVINGKGGTGKTSLVANVAGLAAAAGYRVLTVDLDPQGNLSRDLGYTPPGGNLTLFSALAGHNKVQPLFGVRKNLDVVPAGEDLEDWSALAGSWRARHRSPESALGAALQPVAGIYHLVLVDCPPGNRDLQLLAMHAARFAVVPTRPDEASLDGLVRVARLFETVRPDNPDLQLLGVVLFGIETRAKRIRSDTRAKIDRELGDPGAGVRCGGPSRAGAGAGRAPPRAARARVRGDGVVGAEILGAAAATRVRCAAAGSERRRAGRSARGERPRAG